MVVNFENSRNDAIEFILEKLEAVLAAGQHDLKGKQLLKVVMCKAVACWRSGKAMVRLVSSIFLHPYQRYRVETLCEGSVHDASAVVMREL